jgi:propanol-preferring alcohol dehydrogenase
MSEPTSTYNVIEVSPAGELVAATRPLTVPTGSQVRIRVEACGICHTDAGSVQPHPDTQQGIVPGHEVVGVIDAIGDSVTQWAVGDRVGVGFLGGSLRTLQPLPARRLRPLCRPAENRDRRRFRLSSKRTS